MPSLVKHYMSVKQAQSWYTFVGKWTSSLAAPGPGCRKFATSGRSWGYHAGHNHAQGAFARGHSQGSQLAFETGIIGRSCLFEVLSTLLVLPARSLENDKRWAGAKTDSKPCGILAQVYHLSNISRLIEPLSSGLPRTFGRSAAGFTPRGAS
jgi:hypothetical protein